MKAAIRLIMIIIGLSLIGTAVGAVLLRGQLENLTRQRYAAKLGHVFNSDVRIERIRIVPLERGVELLNVEVDNPPGFKQGPAIQCRRILLRPELRTIFSPTIVFENILVDGVSLDLRFELGKGSNLGALTKQAANLAETQQGGRMVVVKEFACKNAAMKISSNVTPIPFSMEIAPFKLKELREDRPLNTPKLTAVFLRSLLMETLTLKGLLRPVFDLLDGEVKTLPLE